MKKTKNRMKYLLLICMTAVIIAVCYCLPSAIFRLMDVQFIEKRVQKVSNTGNGLNINNLTLTDKLTILKNAVNGNGDVSETRISDGLKRDEIQVMEDGEKELLKLFPSLTTRIGNAEIDLEFHCYACAAAMLTSEQGDSAFLVWGLEFEYEYGIDGSFIHVSMIMDDASGKILLLIIDGMPYEWLEIYINESASANTETAMHTGEAEDETKAISPEQYAYAVSPAICLGQLYAEYLGYSNVEIISDEGEKAVLRLGTMEEGYQISVEVSEWNICINQIYGE